MAAIRYISHLHVPGAYKQHIAVRNMPSFRQLDLKLIELFAHSGLQN